MKRIFIEQGAHIVSTCSCGLRLDFLFSFLSRGHGLPFFIKLVDVDIYQKEADM